MGKGSCRECLWVVEAQGSVSPFFWVRKVPSLHLYCKVSWVFLSY